MTDDKSITKLIQTCMYDPSVQEVENMRTTFLGVYYTDKNFNWRSHTNHTIKNKCKTYLSMRSVIVLLRGECYIWYSSRTFCTFTSCV